MHFAVIVAHSPVLIPDDFYPHCFQLPSHLFLFSLLMEAFPCVLFHMIMVSLTSLVLWSLLAKPILSFLVHQFPGGNKVPPPGGAGGVVKQQNLLSLNSGDKQSELKV